MKKTIFISLLLAGCTFHTDSLNKTNRQIDERVRENTQAGLITNQRTKEHLLETDSNLKNTNYFKASLTLELAKESNEIEGLLLGRNQQLVGLPIRHQLDRVDNLLSTNREIRLNALRRENSYQRKEENLRGDEKEREEKLLDYGAKYEAERNEKIQFWFKWAGIPILLIVGLIAASIFFPPIAGLLVSFLPKLASIFGIVSKSVVSNVVKGVGEVRNQLQQQMEHTERLRTVNPNLTEKTYTAKEVLELLDNQLKVNTDNKDKQIIEHFRAKLNV